MSWMQHNSQQQQHYHHQQQQQPQQQQQYQTKQSQKLQQQSQQPQQQNNLTSSATFFGDNLINNNNNNNININNCNNNHNQLNTLINTNQKNNAVTTTNSKMQINSISAFNNNTNNNLPANMRNANPSTSSSSSLQQQQQLSFQMQSQQIKQVINPQQQQQKHLSTNQNSLQPQSYNITANNNQNHSNNHQQNPQQQQQKSHQQNWSSVMQPPPTSTMQPNVKTNPSFDWQNPQPSHPVQHSHHQPLNPNQNQQNLYNWQNQQTSTTTITNTGPQQQQQQQQGLENYFNLNDNQQQQQQQHPQAQTQGQTQLYAQQNHLNFNQNETVNYFQQQQQQQHQQQPSQHFNPLGVPAQSQHFHSPNNNTSQQSFDLFDKNPHDNNANFQVSNPNQNQNDGWSDWDWNDNDQEKTETNNVETLESSNPLQFQLQSNQPQQHQQQQKILRNDFNSIEDSFSNDAWNWNASEESQTFSSKVASTSSSMDFGQQALPLDSMKPTVSPDLQTMTTTTNNKAYVHEPQIVHSKPTTLALASTTYPQNLETSQNDSGNSSSNIMPMASTITTNSIPNSVHVSQAKPVSRPARQYASPPIGNSPMTDLPESTLTPPQAFQNDLENQTQNQNANQKETMSNHSETFNLNQQQPQQPQQSQQQRGVGEMKGLDLESSMVPTTNMSYTSNQAHGLENSSSNAASSAPQAPPPAVGSAGPVVGPPPSMPPPASATPPLALPPPAMGLSANSSSGNPFKRSGAVQHHRAYGFIAPTAPTSSAPAPLAFNSMTSTVSQSTSSTPPPPPADFANPLPLPPQDLDNMENCEVLTDENQDNFMPPPPPHPNQDNFQISSSSTTTSAAPSASVAITGSSMSGPVLAPMSGPISSFVQHSVQPPPNDERNQYLQTSQLSENPDEDLNLEADHLPPPTMSRLVIGQPELTANNQRLVTGRDDEPTPNIIPIEERQADGEDTSDEQNPPNINPPLSGLPSGNISDRNLYRVPGESTFANDQRVVTGVETIEEISAPLAPPSNEQREIILDGENLEDQQQLQQLQLEQQQINQHHQQQQQQQQQLPHQHQHQHPHSQQQQQQQQHQVLNQNQAIRNEPPLEGAASTALPISNQITSTNNDGTNNHQHHPQQQQQQHVQQSQQLIMKSSKDLSNISTGNDESDIDHHHRRHNKKPNSKHHLEQPNKSERSIRKEKKHYDSESGSEEYSSDHERDDDRERERDRERDRRRGGSVRSDRGLEDRDYRDRKHRDLGETKSRDKYRGGAETSRTERHSKRHGRYPDDSKYETEESTRLDTSRKDATRKSLRSSKNVGANESLDGGGGRSDRSDRDYEEYRQRYQRSSGNKRDKNVERDRRDYDEDRRDRRTRRGADRDRDRDRDDYDTLERHRRRHYHRGGVDPREYEDYRKQSSRNARDSDLEKDRPRDPRLHDPRQAAGMFGYPGAGYAYDPYTAYYYDMLARTNPQAYAEMVLRYKKYYGVAPPGSTLSSQTGVLNETSNEPTSLTAVSQAANAAVSGTTDGRESVHSGRSSAHNEKERYTQAYVSKANEYHQHHQYHQHQHQQHLHRHYQQQQQQHQQQHYHYQIPSGGILGAENQFLPNTSINSSYFDDSLYKARGSVSHFGGSLSAAQSTSNLSQIGSYNNPQRPPSVSGGLIGIGNGTANGSGGLGTGTGGGGGYYSAGGRLDSRFGSGGGGGGGGLYYARSEYADSRSGNFSLRDVEPLAAPEPERLTPCKFTREHTVVSFGSGILVTARPKYSSHGHLSNIVKLSCLNIIDKARSLFKSFPGPLVRGLTHKKTIIEFCEEQIRLGPRNVTIFAKQLLPTNMEKYQASYTLIWNLLILLLRQNGMVVGTDIAGLLLANQQQYPYQPSNNSQSLSLSGSNSRSLKSNSEASDAEGSDLDANSNDLEEPAAGDLKESLSSEIVSNIETEPKTSSVENELSETEVTEKFRNYLLYGNVHEALNWATDNNLWGHALFLASKVDPRLHANVLMKFANKLSLSDPLQTLYQLMSGRTPSSVTSIQDEKWGDWRPHLSMILSNTSQKPELDRKAIMTLGDSLFNRGDLYAAHFCYLMAQVNFGRYQETASLETSLQQNLPKLVLLGSSHYKGFQDFATNEAMVMTEIYEYACSLNDDKFSIVEFQPYKYLLATRLLDYGYHLKSFLYLEQVSKHIQLDPSKYETSFITKVFEMADRLKFYDPVLEKGEFDLQSPIDGGLNTSDNANDAQKWLNDLGTLLSQQKINYNAMSSSYPHLSGGEQQTESFNLQNQIDQQFREINQQFSELNLQYANDVMPTTTTQTNAPTFYNPETLQQNQQTHDTNQQMAGGYDGGNQQYPGTTPDNLMSQGKQLQSNDHYYQNQYIQESGDQQTHHQQQQQYTQNSYYDPNQQLQQQQVPSTDYWTQQQDHFNSLPSDENAARPTISMPKSRTYDSDDEKQKKSGVDGSGGGGGGGGGSGSLANQQQNKKDSTNQQQQQQQKNKNDKDSGKSSQQGNQNSGWFGGIWNKLSLKPKNQMILPDDKNPTIVWDPDKKRWVNTDGDAPEEENLKPPPKMSDIMPKPQSHQVYGQQIGQQQQQMLDHSYQSTSESNSLQSSTQSASTSAQSSSQSSAGFSSGYAPQQGYELAPPTSATPPAVPLLNTNTNANVPLSSTPGVNVGNFNAPSAGSVAPKQPSLQSNMFKMQRNRTLKNSYVDVFNPSGAPMTNPAETILAPSLPPAVVPPSGFFIPGAPVQSQNDNNQYQQQQQQTQDTPQFYNPNHMSGGANY